MTAGFARMQTAWLGIRPNTRGAIWMFFCGALFAGADGLAKYFTREGFDVFQIACAQIKRWQGMGLPPGFKLPGMG